MWQWLDSQFPRSLRGMFPRPSDVAFKCQSKPLARRTAFQCQNNGGIWRSPGYRTGAHPWPVEKGLETKRSRLVPSTSISALVQRFATQLSRIPENSGGPIMVGRDFVSPSYTSPPVTNRAGSWRIDWLPGSSFCKFPEKCCQTSDGTGSASVEAVVPTWEIESNTQFSQISQTWQVAAQPRIAIGSRGIREAASCHL